MNLIFPRITPIRVLFTEFTQEYERFEILRYAKSVFVASLMHARGMTTTKTCIIVLFHTEHGIH